MNIFSEHEEEKLIDIVFAHPVLYDISHQDYRNNVVKENTWKAIDKELNKNSDECKKKWKSIRDSYHRFKKKHKLGSSAPKQSKDKRHVLLSFLDTVPHRSAGFKLSSSPTEDSVDPLSADEQELSNDGTSHTDKDSDEEIAEDNANEVKKRNKDLMAKVWKERDEKRQSVKSILRNKEDDIDLFVRHIGEVLRNLPQVEKAQAKKHLNEVLSDYEISAAKNSQPQSTSSQNILKRKINENPVNAFENIQSAKRKMYEFNDEFDFYGQNVASELRSVNYENAVLQAKSLINNILIDTRMNKYLLRM